ncbi:protein-disulfide reductase DsbD domain-containing protein [Sorangium sp. So ce1099]|uniref:protein-disulfide reductase DsbD domain-containing protein n=1 Tax=Sorangium sp. So ce1099 TaxID=3133331 RepID=UPI003F5FFA81
MKKTFAIAALFVAALTGTAVAADSYDLSVNAPASKVNQKATAKVSVQTKGDWHVNKDYPHKLTLVAPAGVKIEKTTLTAKEAAKFDEKQLAFDVTYTAAKAGKAQIKGTLKFGICQGENVCVPKTENIVISVSAK